MQRIILSQLDPFAIIHPKDKNVIKWVDKIPFFKRFLNDTINKYISISANVKFRGNGLTVNEENYPCLYNRYVEDCKIVGKKEIPEFSLLWGYFLNSLSIGTDTGERIVLSSGAIDQLSDTEQDFLIGHELGHIMTGHKPYHTLVESLCDPMFDISRQWIKLLKFPLLEWYRLSHFTADRMGLLCCQDINVCLSAMIKLAGLPVKYYEDIDIEGFKKQARDFEELHGGKFAMAIKALSIFSANSPWLVRRAKELIEWYESDEYKKIIANH